jgi:hypothetical protein
LIRFIQAICSDLIRPRTFDETVACMVKPEEDEVEEIHLSEPRFFLLNLYFKFTIFVLNIIFRCSYRIFSYHIRLFFLFFVWCRLLLKQQTSMLLEMKKNQQEHRKIHKCKEIYFINHTQKLHRFKKAI